MAALKDPATENPSDRPRESLPRALRDVLIAALILGALFGWYYHHVQIQKQVSALSKEARDFLAKDVPKTYRQAEEKLSEVLALDDASPYAIAAMAELSTILWSEGGVADYKAKADRYVALADGSGAQIGERYASKAIYDIAAGDGAGAERFLTGVIEKGGAAGKVVDALGRAQRAQGKLTESRHAFKRAHDTEWRSPRFATDLAQSHAEQSDWQNARQYYLKALDANSDHLRALIGRSRVQTALGQRIDENRDTLKDVLSRSDDELTPNLRAEALTGQAELLLWEKNPGDALKAADEALAANAAQPWAHKARGLALAETKACDDAWTSLTKSIELDKLIPSFYFDGAFALLECGKPERAVELMALYEKNGLELDGRYFLAYGDLLRKKGDAPGAHKKYDLAIEKDPLDAEPYFRKAQLAFEQKDLKTCAEFAEKAVQAREKFPEVYKLMGRVYLAAKKSDDALEQFGKALFQFREAQVPHPAMVAYVDEVEEYFKKAGQKKDAQVWAKEAKGLITP